MRSIPGRATGGWWADSAQVDHTFRPPAQPLKSSASSSGGRPGGATALLTAQAWLVPGRDHMVGPLDYDQRRAASWSKGLRAQPVIKLTWTHRTTPRCEESRPHQGDRPADVGAAHLRSLEVLPVIFDLAEEGRAAARDPRCARCPAAGCGGTSTASPRSTTPPGARTGASPPTRRPTSASTLRAALIFDAHWFMIAETQEGGTAAVRSRSGHQSGPQAHGRPAAADRLVALPAAQADHGPAAVGFLGVKPESSTPAWRRRCTSSTST